MLSRTTVDIHDDIQQQQQQQRKQHHHHNSSFLVLLENREQYQQLKLANEYSEAGYNFVWKEQEYEEAIRVLQQALQLQQKWLGKHHNDVGYTCNFIGTAHWLNNNNNNNNGNDQHHLRPAMKYFLEARRIFSKAGRGKVVKGIDQRIRCVLEDMALKQEEISQFQGAIQRTIEHELQGDRLKRSGQVDQAKLEYQKARWMSASLNNLL
jgi:tetratricopeptide (TPR) repeat protein